MALVSGVSIFWRSPAVSGLRLLFFCPVSCFWLPVQIIERLVSGIQAVAEEGSCSSHHLKNLLCGGFPGSSALGVAPGRDQTWAYSPLPHATAGQSPFPFY